MLQYIEKEGTIMKKLFIVLGLLVLVALFESPRDYALPGPTQKATARAAAESIPADECTPAAAARPDRCRETGTPGTDCAAI